MFPGPQAFSFRQFGFFVVLVDLKVAESQEAFVEPPGLVAVLTGLHSTGPRATTATTFPLKWARLKPPISSRHSDSRQQPLQHNNYPQIMAEGREHDQETTGVAWPLRLACTRVTCTLPRPLVTPLLELRASWNLQLLFPALVPSHGQ